MFNQKEYRKEWLRLNRDKVRKLARERAKKRWDTDPIWKAKKKRKNKEEYERRKLRDMTGLRKIWKKARIKNRVKARVWNRNYYLRSKKARQAMLERVRRDRLTPKGKARQLVQTAVKYGRLIRPSNCSKCSIEGKIQAHHHDYSKPLDVIWLCPLCHGAEHIKHK